MVLVTMTPCLKIWLCVLRYSVPDYSTVRSVITKILALPPTLLRIETSARALNQGHEVSTFHESEGGPWSFTQRVFALVAKVVLFGGRNNYMCQVSVN